MKKTILTCLALTLTLSASAAVVSLSKAESVAKAFMGASSVTLAWDGNESVATRASAVAPAFYVYNISGGGWVIISAEDCVTPVLGYSDTGTFKTDGMPANISRWFGVIRDDILQARSDKLEQTEAVRNKWNNPMRVRPKTASGYKLLDTPLWNQGTPYNKLLSTYVKKNGSGVSNLYTGCVATAMAEVLYYHKWPEKGTGTLAGYTTASYSYTVSSIDISQHTYDWDNMLDSYSSYNTTQADAVALLMLDCGVMTQMDYSSQGSGTMSEYVVPALVEHMQYSKAAQIKYRMDYTTEEWMDMIAYDIENCGPILYGGQDTSSSGQDAGHQFVCTGYNLSDVTVYINWGWSGSNNGWFTLDLAIPGSYTFDSGQSAIFGLVPDRDGSSEYPDDKESERLTLEYYSSSYTGLMLKSGTVESGQTFSMSAGVIWNLGESDYSGKLKLVLVDEDGNLLEDNVSADVSLSLEQFYGSDVTFTNCKFSTPDADINVGDHLEIWFSNSSGGWSPVNYNVEDYSCTGVWQIVDASFIKVKGSYSDGDKYYFTLIPGNTPVSSIVWSYDGTVTTNAFVSLTSGTHTVTAAITYTDNTSETITQDLVVN